MTVKAFCLLSGGLDSILAARLLQEQGIQVIGVHFTSPFFDKSEIIQKAAKELKIEVCIIDISEEYIQLLQEPLYGYGKNFNPCIDCHSYMMRKAVELLDFQQPEFLATGEVLDQRPMSQNRNSLGAVAKYAGLKGYVLRPLSAKHLPLTIPEKKGWVNRDRLLNIRGRGRKKQLELLNQWGLSLPSTPGGGCVLTNPTFSRKLFALKKKQDLNNPKLLKAMNWGRILEISPHKYAIVSRNEQEGLKLKQSGGEWSLQGKSVNGPFITGWGKINAEEAFFLGKVFSFYSQAKGREKISVLWNNQELRIPPLEKEEMQKEIQKAIL